MTWTPEQHRTVTRALIGSWPSQVASWGPDAIAAYIEELQARSVQAEGALVAIRACPAGQKFPPSAPELAALARQDPNRPTFDELMAQLYGPGGVFGFKRSNVTISPWVTAFVALPGNRERLRLLEVDDPSEGKWRRRELQDSWESFLAASEGREVAAIATGRRGELGRPDLLGAIGLPPRPQIGGGE